MRYVSFGLIALLCACSSAPGGNGGETTHASPVAPASDPSLPSAGIATASNAGFTVASLSVPSLCVGTILFDMVYLVPCTGPLAVRFSLSGGRWHTNDGRCLDVVGGLPSVGKQLQVQPCVAGAAASQSFGIAGNGALSLKVAGGAVCVNTGASATAGQGTAGSVVLAAPLVLGACDPRNSSLWWLAPEGMVVKPAGDNGRCLQAQSDPVQVGDPTVLAACDGSAKQRWSMWGNQLRLTQASTLCLDVNRNVASSGNATDLWTCGPGAAQNFSFTGDVGNLQLSARPDACLSASAGAAVSLGACGLPGAWTFSGSL